MSPIARLRGTVLERSPDGLIVEVGGVGFQVYCPAGTLAQANIGSQVALHTYLLVREDGLTLYGFGTAQEQRLFQALLGVSGVGPKVALALLSVMSADEISYAIASGNAAALARAPGVGQKLANRVVLELQDKLAVGAPVALPDDGSEIVAALVGLGYSQAEALEAVAKSELPPDAPVEEKVRLALGYFSQANPSSPGRS